MRAGAGTPEARLTPGEGVGEPSGVLRLCTGVGGSSPAAADDGGGRRAGLCLCVAAEIGARCCTLSPCRSVAARALKRTEPAHGAPGGRAVLAYHGGSDSSQMPAPARVGVRVPGSPVPQQPVLHRRQGGGLLCSWGRGGVQHPRAQPKIFPGTQRRHYQVRTAGAVGRGWIWKGGYNWGHVQEPYGIKDFSWEPLREGLQMLGLEQEWGARCRWEGEICPFKGF